VCTALDMSNMLGMRDTLFYKHAHAQSHTPWPVVIPSIGWIMTKTNTHDTYIFCNHRGLAEQEKPMQDGLCFACRVLQICGFNPFNLTHPGKINWCIKLYGSVDRNKRALNLLKRALYLCNRALEKRLISSERKQYTYILYELNFIKANSLTHNRYVCVCACVRVYV